MTNGPRLRLGESLLPGVLAVALFGAMALIVFNTGFNDEMVGFPEGISITAELGYALLGLAALQSTEMAVGNTEPFLISFLLIAIVLDAALDASLVLAKRETEGEPVSALSSTPAEDSSATETASAVTDGGTGVADEDAADSSGGEGR